MLEGVDVTQTNMSFFRQQLQHIATHILRCTGKLYEQYKSIGLGDWVYVGMFWFQFSLNLYFLDKISGMLLWGEAVT